MQENNNIIANSSLQPQAHSLTQPRTSWNFPRVGKLGFYLFITVMVILGFASSFGWVPWFDAALSSVAAGLGIVGSAGYSFAKNLGVYSGDGKQKGNTQILAAINDITNDVQDIQEASGIKFMVANGLLNLAAVIIAFFSIGPNIPAKADKSYWYLGIPGFIMGALAAGLIVIANEIAAPRLRKIQDQALNRLETLEKQKVEEIHARQVQSLTNQLQDKEQEINSRKQEKANLAAENDQLKEKMKALERQLTKNHQQLEKSKVVDNKVSQFLSNRVEHWKHQKSVYQNDEKIYVKLSTKQDKEKKLNEKLYNAHVLKQGIESNQSDLNNLEVENKQQLNSLLL